MADPNNSKPKAQTSIKDQAESEEANKAKEASQDAGNSIQNALDQNASGNSKKSNSSQAELTRFQSAMATCFSKFEHLRVWIEENSDSLVGTTTFKAMSDWFQNLQTWQKVLVLLTVLAVLGLLRWGTWALISWIWPHLVEFVSTGAGKHLLSATTSIVQTVTESGLVEQFGASLLCGAQAEAKEETTTSGDAAASPITDSEPAGKDADDAAPLHTAWWDKLVEKPVEGLTALISQLLAFVVRVLIGGGGGSDKKPAQKK